MVLSTKQSGNSFAMFRPQSHILALDFDGVIVDSIEECLIIGHNAYSRHTGRGRAFARSEAMAAGIATLTQLQKPGVYEALNENSKRLITGLGNAAQKAGIAARVGHVGSMLGMFFTDQNVSNFDDAKTCDLELFSRFYQGLRQQGIYIAPSQFEVLFL